MWKRIALLAAALLVIAGSLAFAAERTSRKPVVVVLYQNHAETDYNKAIDKKFMKNFKAALPASTYVWVDGKNVMKKLQEQGIDDIYTAERSDIIRALGNEPVDYVLYAEAQPFIRKEKSSWFSHGIEMTTQVPFKIVDVAGDKYLYSGQLSIKADSTTFIGGIGNRGVVMEAVDKANQRISEIIAQRMPKTVTSGEKSRSRAAARQAALQEMPLEVVE